MAREGIRFATLEDAEAIREIYRPYIEETAVTFEYDVPTIDEFKERIRNTLNNYPYIVYTIDDCIIGYAYASRHRARAAYGWNVELSIYLDKKCVAKGIGTILYTALIEILKLQNIYNVYGCLTPPNPKSEKLHERLGFHKCGVFKNTGYKFEQWHDVVWFEKCIRSNNASPKPFLRIHEVSRSEITQILKHAIEKE